jgi:hypothetical protein
MSAATEALNQALANLSDDDLTTLVRLVSIARGMAKWSTPDEEAIEPMWVVGDFDEEGGFE